MEHTTACSMVRVALRLTVKVTIYDGVYHTRLVRFSTVGISTAVVGIVPVRKGRLWSPLHEMLACINQGCSRVMTGPVGSVRKSSKYHGSGRARKFPKSHGSGFAGSGGL